MRRPKPPKLCQNPDGRAFVILPASGKKRKYLGRYGSEEADAAYKQFLREWADDAPQPVAPTKPKLVLHLVDAYLEHCREYYGPTATEFQNARASLGRLANYFGTRPLSELGSGMLLAHRTKLLRAKFTRGKGENAVKRPFSRNVINRDVEFIRRMAKWALARELITAEQFLRLKAVESLRRGKTTAPETDPVKPVAWSAVAATLPHLPPVVSAMARVQYLCGLRPGEVCSMRVEELDRSGSVWLYSPGQHKNAHRGQSLVKAVPPAAQEILLPIIADRDAGPVFRLAEVIPAHLRDAKRQARQYGESFTTAVYGRVIARACELAGVVRWSPNQLRHAIATDLRARLGWEAAQLYLGHASPDTTAIYAESSKAKLSAIAASVRLPNVGD